MWQTACNGQLRHGLDPWTDLALSGIKISLRRCNDTVFDPNISATKRRALQNDHMFYILDKRECRTLKPRFYRWDRALRFP